MDESYRRERWIGIIETWGELKEEVRVYNSLIKPLDEGRDYNNIETPQRLLVELNVELQEYSSWNPQAIVDDISAILSLATGRLMRPSKYSCHEDELNGSLSVIGRPNRSYRVHPNLTVPVQNEALQDEVNHLTQSLLNAYSDKDSGKYSSLMRAIRLYRDSLNLLPIDDDAAYVLLVASGETLASEFSTINPTFDDLDFSNKIRGLIRKHNLGDDFLSELSEILVEPKHMKLQAKFIDVIKTHLRPDFFEKPEKHYIPVGSYDQENDRFKIEKWEGEEAPWFIKADQLERCLKNIYRTRSKFVHDGIEWPHYTKIGGGHDIITPIKLDQQGVPKKRSDGTYVTEQQIPSYFWFERVMNNVIQKVIRKVG